MTVIIKFYKVASKKYDAVCKQACGFENFVQGYSENTITLDEKEMRVKEKRIQLELILNTLRSWKSTEYYIDNSSVKAENILVLLQIFDCERKCDSSQITDGKYCFEKCCWGCNFLKSVLEGRISYGSCDHRLCWYDFGRFENNVWIINKESILNNLMQEAKDKHLSVCVHFAEERIRSSVNSLLDKIDVNDNSEWEYKYRNTPVGMVGTEVIGVQPKESFYNIHSSYTTTINLDDHKEKQDITIKEKNIPDIKFSDIGGIDDIIQQIREVIEFPLIAPDLLEYYGIKPHKGILLYGPPGCGKTMIAKAIANEIEAHFISVNGPEILNMFLGESEANLRRIFEEAKNFSPSIIYFDEFDSIASTRDSEMAPYLATVVNQLLTLMDGVDSTNQICCIASTNRIDMIDPAIKRPGRFDYVIEVKKPSLDGCKSIFEINTSKMPVADNFDKDTFVEKYLQGCTGAEIAYVVSEAAYNAIRRNIDVTGLCKDHGKYIKNEQSVVTESDFVKAANNLKQSRENAKS